MVRYNKIKPHRELEPFIDYFWELQGNQCPEQWERVYPDGCAGILINLGGNCLTDNGSLTMETGKTYLVGAMNLYKDSFIDAHTHLAGVCFRPGAFSNFYNYAPQNELINDTVEFEKPNSFNIDKANSNPFHYFNVFFLENIKNKNSPLQSVISDIHWAEGQISIYELSRKNCTTTRQLERNFKKYIGLSPKEYCNIIRFRNALKIIKTPHRNQSLLDIAYQCGYYDHSHLANEIKRNTGLSPSLL